MMNGKLRVAKDGRKRVMGTPRAAELLGITPDQFRRLAKRIGLQAQDWYRNPYYRSGPMCPLWASQAIERLVGSAEVAAVHEQSRHLAEAIARKRVERPRELR